MSKKIALCLHGYFNSLTDLSSKGEDGFRHIKKHILDSRDVDVFVHSFDLKNEDRIIELYNPKNIIFEKQIDFSEEIKSRKLDKLKYCPRPIQSVFSHLFSVQESINLCFLSEKKYDIIIKSRFDLGRINRFTSIDYPVQCINFRDDLDMDRFYMADWPRFNCGPADMWFYSCPKNMMKLRSLFDSYLSQCYIGSEFHEFATNIENNPGDLSNAVVFYKFFLEKCGLWSIKEPLKCTYE